MYNIYNIVLWIAWPDWFTWIFMFDLQCLVYLRLLWLPKIRKIGQKRMKIQKIAQWKKSTAQWAHSLKSQRSRMNVLLLQKKRASSLLHCLLGQTFSDASVTPHHPHQSACAIVEEEMTRYHSTQPLALSEEPLNWWYVHTVSFPFVSKMAKRYLCIPVTSVRESFPLQELLLQCSEAHLLLNMRTNCCSYSKT